jgi:Glycosyl hydrolase catalytic core
MMAGSSRRWFVLAAVLLVAGAGLVLLGLSRLWQDRTIAVLGPTHTPLPTATEPILPPFPTATRSPTPLPMTETASPVVSTPLPVGSPVPAMTASPTSTPVSSPTLTIVSTETSNLASTPVPSPSPTTAPSATAAPPQKGLYTRRQRLGVAISVLPPTQDLAQQLGFGWYLNWSVDADEFRSAEVGYMPMIRLGGGRPSPSGQALLRAVDALPGAVWLIGNEPDVKWQDNVPPDVYAQLYHDLYKQLKARDPTCQVAIGGVSQPTPLRLRYLDRILEAYQARYGAPMPVDVWNVHAFILREERGSWGVDIPPGMAEQTGKLYEIADHDDMAIFRQQMVDFRRWMKEQGQQDKPLIVTEYGILMPNEYGFPPQQVERFMLDTFEFFRTATDPALGYPADGYRLVQRWCWFSLADERYPTGNLARPDRQFTSLGKAFRTYAYTAP